MRRIGRALVWLRRVNHCRGFGVQSPWAYRFIRYVVNEHNPYYAYERMNDQLPDLDEQTRKMCRLYFRLANFMQAQRIFSYCSPTTAYAAYMKEGCKKTSVVEIGEDDVESFETTCADNQSVEFLRISPQGNYQTLYEKALPYMDSKSMMVVEDIHKKQETKEFWKMGGDDFREGLLSMARNTFRVRPWFEPGVWGGVYMRDHFDGLNRDVENLAWSFELMTRENGLILESDGLRLEFAFEFLMYAHARDILGRSFDRFGYDFPIRFDFLDTIRGGNLSIQCHPTTEYIRREFGMPFTQDETYYILENEGDSSVYLGFQDDIDKDAFLSALEGSQRESREIDIEKYVQRHPLKKHDLFLIPNGTIHGSGSGNLVLEISSAPYIFTFKMYDWMRLDTDGKPRPINIRRGMDNVDFSRKGGYVSEHLICHPYIMWERDGVKAEHLPTHPEHFYDVFRYTVEASAEFDSDAQVDVWMLTEGSSVMLETSSGMRRRYNYAETFVIPSACGKYVITNEARGQKAVLVRARVKDE